MAWAFSKDNVLDWIKDMNAYYCDKLDKSIRDVQGLGDAKDFRYVVCRMQKDLDLAEQEGRMSKEKYLEASHNVTSVVTVLDMFADFLLYE